MVPYSINDPTNKTSLKAKVIVQQNFSINILFEIIHLKNDNMTKLYDVQFFLDVDDFDYLYQLYRTKQITVERSFFKQKGYNGKVRNIKILARYEKLTPGHLSFSIQNGTGTPLNNGYTPKMENIEHQRMINISYEQSIKLFKYLERSILAHTIKQI